MAEFIAGLLSFIALFFQTATPETVPEFNQDELTVIGEQISDIAKNLDPQAEDSQQTDENTQEETGGSTDSSEATGSAEPQSDEEENAANGQIADTTKVEAHNSKSGKDMPTLIPQVAINNSVALEPISNNNNGAGVGSAEENTQEETDGNTEEETNTQGETNEQDNQNNEQETEPSTGQEFGMEKKAQAKQNSKRQ